jgi:hypothetical protein
MDESEHDHTIVIDEHIWCCEKGNISRIRNVVSRRRGYE